ncbi:hypothetical protein BU25DRAFT_247007 [Macroventuria anomochaeta]|uniref:Uncharacterized protein n=1 Tax=Macroventuria anomochaeta TaxID=301207 RepID=A0ACB6SB59_9PLEO|nr:uncharacterized protein BU25DRAFT_247007 [Macroventuria anomochaeta]KAF2630747.1 hypothetical protein BU25DRAFT_247007 [Macroventuria anomochaeta]
MGEECATDVRGGARVSRAMRVRKLGVMARAGGRFGVGRAAEGCESRPTRNCLRSTGGCGERHSDDGGQKLECAGLQSALRMATCAVGAIRVDLTGVGSNRGSAALARQIEGRSQKAQQHHSQHLHRQYWQLWRFALRVAVYVPLDVGR